MIQPAARLARLQPYFFADLHRRVAEMLAAGHDIIRMDMGSPDMPPAEPIIRTLQQGAGPDGQHGYSGVEVARRFRQAVAGYYLRRFGVALDPEAEALGLLGSKEGIFNIHLALVNPGDVVLVPDPGYPIYAAAARLAGAEIVTIPLLAENNFLPDLSAIPDEALARTALLWLNYPNNPTAALAPEGFFRAAAALARKHGFLICHDAAYVDVTFGGAHAGSALAADPGAREVTLEFGSLSKTYNMAGWRLGMACGNRAAVRALATVKSNVDSGHFQPALEGGIAALTGDQSWITARNETYRQRRDMVLEALPRAGLRARTPPNGPGGTIYVWAQVPPGQTSAGFARRLLEAAGVSAVPGAAYGAHGEGHIRLALGIPTERVREAMERLIATA